MKNIFVIAMALPICLSGCANRPGAWGAPYAAPHVAYNCEQISAELGRVYASIHQLGGAALPERAMATGAKVPSSAILMMGGSKEQVAEFSRLKSEYEALEQLGDDKRCELDNASASTGGDTAKNSLVTQKTRPPADHPSYTLLPSGVVVPDAPSAMPGVAPIPVRSAAPAPIFKKSRGDVCDKHVASGDYCWWSPPGNYSMCPPIPTYSECMAQYGAGCQLGHGKVLPLC